MFAVLEIDDKYSPRIKLYNMKSGTNGEMKMKKKDFNEDKLEGWGCN